MVGSASDAERLIDNWERDAETKAARFQEMAARVEQVSITESVAGGAVRVTVGHNGLPTDVAMTDKVLEMRPEEIAGNVMAAMRKAQSRYPARLAEILAETVGVDDPASQHILAQAEANFPAPEEEERAEGEPLRFSDVEDQEPTRPRRAPQARQAPPRGGDGRNDDGDHGGDHGGDFGEDVTVFKD